MMSDSGRRREWGNTGGCTTSRTASRTPASTRWTPRSRGPRQPAPRPALTPPGRSTTTAGWWVILYCISYTRGRIEIITGSGHHPQSGSWSNPDWWLLMTKNWRKKSELKIFFYLFSIKNCNSFCPSYRRSLQPSKENIGHFKKCNLLTCFYVCVSFLPSWIRNRIRIQGPHWIGSTTLEGAMCLVKSFSIQG